MIENWIFFAFLAALAQAANALVNEYWKVSSLYLLLWVRFFVTLCLVPVALQFPAPTDIYFYLSCLGAVLCFSYFDLIYFSRAADRGAGLITRFEGLIVGMTFLMWLLIDPTLVVKYAQEPMRAAGIIASLLGAIYFALKLRHCEISYQTLRSMLPALALGALGIVCAALAMRHSSYHSGVWYYALFQSFAAFCIYCVVLNVPYFKKFISAATTGHKLFDKRVLMAALCLSFGWLVHTPSKYYAIKAVENPAYVTLIGLTAPLWVLLVYRLAGRPEKSDILSGLGIVFCAVLLVVFTQF